MTRGIGYLIAAQFVSGLADNALLIVAIARLAELGAEAHILPSCPDEPQAVADALIRAAREADVLITTGGVSVGKKDIMHRVLPLMGAHRLFKRLSLSVFSRTLRLFCFSFGFNTSLVSSANFAHITLPAIFNSHLYNSRNTQSTAAE